MRILITGGNSGIGYQAVIKLLDLNHNVILPCRDKKTSELTLKKLKSEFLFDPSKVSRAVAPIMDLSDLRSIESFSSSLVEQNLIIDLLILNAGMQYTGAKKPKISAQGYELTFVTNYLSHHYLTYLLLPLLVKNKTKKIIITSSEVHNPESPGGKVGKPAGLKDLKGLCSTSNFNMLDGVSEFSADKAYKDSKLCDILFAKELDRKLKENNIPIQVIAWAPGLVIPKGNNGFFKYSRIYNELGQRIFAFIARDILRISIPPEIAGEALKRLSVEDKYHSSEFEYYVNDNRILGRPKLVSASPSLEANNKLIAEKLWNCTCDLLKISREINIKI